MSDYSNLQILNAILYITEHGCKWRGLPKCFGNWHTIYTRINRWAKSGVLQKAFEQLQRQQIIRIKIGAVSLNGTCIKARYWYIKKTTQSIGKSRSGWTNKIHLVAADARTIITFALSPGYTHDAPEGRQLLLALGPVSSLTHLLRDHAYEGDQTRQLALKLGYIPIVPPKANRLEP